MSAIWSRNQGSIFVASCASSTVTPPRRACCTWTIRPSVGTFASSMSSSACSRVGSSPSQWKAAPLRSTERRAFCSASVKLRPRDIASPTDFIVVVRVGSAAGNFSKAKRGTLTTT